ncbi:hypothetical protein BKA62DRAFT_747614 [Auriculariales sp. MPI-PUGE-AT-0066]|nr:hypothetical protein BKA62DRAFT_747614 [Auriculariales sp. MPI-PUGE-AT-0066]
MSTANAKGKQRAAGERTPLLGTPTSSSSSSRRPRRVVLPPADGESEVSRRDRICAHVLTGCLALCSLLFVVVLFITLITRPSAPSSSPEQLFDRAVHFRGPSALDILNITNPLTTPDHAGGIWLRMDGDIFVDADYVLREMASTGVSWWGDIRLRIGRWLLRAIQDCTVELGTLSVYAPQADTGAPPLVRVYMPTFVVPLEPNTTYAGAPYSPFSLPVLLSPTRDVAMLAEYAAMAWKSGVLQAKVKADTARVHGGDMTPGPMLASVLQWGWKGLVSVTVDNFKKTVSVPIPKFSGLPAPGGELPSASAFVTLLSYAMVSTDSHISARANASFLNIFRSMNLPAGFSMTIPETPIVVSLPIPLPDYQTASVGKIEKPPCIDIHNRTDDEAILLPVRKYMPVARISVPPQVIPPPGHPENITIEATGRLIPLQPSQRSMLAISPFLSAYLKGEPYDVLVTVDLPIVSSPGVAIDTLIDPNQTLSVHIPFPGANPKPHILQELTIHDMRIRYGRDTDSVIVSGVDAGYPLEPIDGPIRDTAGDYTVLASGTVYAHVILPPQFDVHANVTRVWPDVILSDGQLPDPDEDVSRGEVEIQAPPRVQPSPAEPTPTWRAFSGPDSKQRALEAAAAVAAAAALQPEPTNPNNPWRYDGCPEPLPPYDPQDDSCVHRPPADVPLPDPLPEAAFARIRTADWIAAVSQEEPDPKDPTRRVVVVQARFEDVPVTVLHGRENRMRSFVRKAIFSTHGADAGIDGVAAVGAVIDGLVAPPRDALDDDEVTGEIELHGLPVHGNVRVGGKLIHP